MRKLSIAIDGPAGAGKSSVSKILASRLGYAYLDTGAMYRAVTYEALKKGLTDPAEITAMTKALDMEVKPGMDAMHVIVDGEDVTPFIRTPEVSGHVSEVSAIGGVRTAMVAIQRRQAERGGIVLDGRDIGTTVLPSVKLSTETSGPVRNSSTTMRAPLSPNFFSSIMDRTAAFASSLVSAIITPLPRARPSALITVGTGAVSRYSSAGCISSNTS